MARQILSAVTPTMAGSAVAFTAPTVDGDAVPPHSALLVRNTSAGPLNVTIVTGGAVGGRAIPDDVVAVAAGATVLLGPFTEAVLPQPTGTTRGYVHVDYATPASFERVALDLSA